MNNTIIITGASRGIGRKTALVLAKSGYSIAAVYNKNETLAQELVQELIALGADADCFNADISDSDSVRSMYEAVTHRFGGVYALVNNAGITEQALFQDIDDESWNKMISTNLSGAFYCTKAVLPAMIASKRGKIINISSIWGQTGAAAEVHYSAAKAGIIGMTKALAKEVAPSGITVNCVCPGVIETDMLSCFTADELSALREDIPLGRLGKPEDIAQTVNFLLSSGADFITGQIIGVNGGAEC